MGNENTDNTSEEPVDEIKHYGGAIRASKAVLEEIPFLSQVSRRVTLPDSVDLSSNFPPVGNQGTQNSCVGWAIAYALKTYQEQVERNWGVKTSDHQFSPAFVYNLRYGEVPGSNEKDDGMSIPTGIKIVIDKGLCTLADMPYKINDYTTRPNAAQKAAALKYKAVSYSRIKDNDISTIKEQLYNGNPVLILIPTYSDLRNLSSSNPVVDNTNGETYNDVGGHALCLLGYDDNYQYKSTKGVFKFINSWGTKSGINGYGYISYALIKDNSADIETYVLNDKIDVTGVILSSNSIELPIGESQTLSSTILPAKASNKVVNYTSVNSSVATVSSSGKVYAAGIGATAINANSNDPDSNAAATCSVKVKDASISLNTGSIELYIGESQTLTKTVTPSNSITRNVTWNSSNPAVATISSSGTVKAISPGETTISVKCNYPNSSASSSCRVTVKDVNDSLFVSDTIPDKVTAGRTYHVSITLKNVGILSWMTNYCLGTDVNNNTNGSLFLNGSNRITFPSGTTIKPGEIYLVNFQMKIPEAAGVYKLNFKMLNSAAVWFGAILEKKIVVYNPDDESVLNTYGFVGAYNSGQLANLSHCTIRNERFWSIFNTYGSIGTFKNAGLKNDTNYAIRTKRFKNQHCDLYDFTYSQMQVKTQIQLREGEL